MSRSHKVFLSQRAIGEVEHVQRKRGNRAVVFERFLRSEEECFHDVKGKFVVSDNKR